jgi:NADPH-dependent 7-cyano-7-deazaguanine reductase QueF
VSLTVPCASAAVTVQITVPLTHRCPFRDEIDHGSVEIQWTTAGNTFELYTLRAWLDSHAGMAISHEDITRAIAAALSERPGIRDVRVRTRWTTAGAGVVVASDLSGQRQFSEGA